MKAVFVLAVILGSLWGAYALVSWSYDPAPLVTP